MSNNRLFYKNVYRHTESEQWERIAQQTKTNKLIIIGYVEKLKDIAARSLKRGYIEKDDIGKIAYKNISIKKADLIFDALVATDYLEHTETQDLYKITNWNLYQDNIVNYEERSEQNTNIETKEEHIRRQKKESAQRRRASERNTEDSRIVEQNIELVELM